MPSNTYTLIASSTVGAGGASSIDFTSIPSTYTDLVLKASVRPAALDDMYIKLNTSTASFSGKRLNGNGASASSDSSTYWLTPQTATASTFSSFELYLPNYAGSTNKSFSIDAVSENNATTAYMSLSAGLWSNTAAITGVTLYMSTSTFVQYTTAYIYGVKNA